MSRLSKTDRIVSLYICEKGGWKCWFVGKDTLKCSDQMQCNHIIGRTNRRLRFDEKNLVCGCSKHNWYYSRFNRYRPGMEEKLHELVRRVDPERWNYLERVRALSSGKMNAVDIKLIVLPMKEKFLSWMADRHFKYASEYEPPEYGMYLTYHPDTDFRVTQFNKGSWTEGVRVQMWDSLRKGVA